MRVVVSVMFADAEADWPEVPSRSEVIAAVLPPFSSAVHRANGRQCGSRPPAPPADGQYATSPTATSPERMTFTLERRCKTTGRNRK